MQRRDFLKRGAEALPALASAAALLGSGRSLVPAPAWAQGDAVDERFWAQVRQQFPLTRDRTYLNNGGLGPSPYVAIRAVQDKMDELEQISETGHSHELWQSIKEVAARAMGCLAEELAYTRNTTEGVSIVCNGLRLKRGDEVITSTHEHVGNTMAWLARQRRDGIVLKVFEPSLTSAAENVERIEQLITRRTRALSISHVTTATGQVLPVREIGQVAARHDLFYFIDGAQSAGMMPLDMAGIGCHAYATSGHKWLLGPKGTGLLFVRRDKLDAVEAKFVGAYSNEGDLDLRTGQFQLNSTAQRYEYGTVSVPLFVGLGAAVQFLLDLGLENVWRRDHAMATRLMEGLEGVGARVLSPRHPDEHSAIVTFRVDGMSKDDLQGFLSRKYQLRTRGIYEGGLDAVRVSLHLYNSYAEVERVVEGVRAAMAA
ncbi:MAG: aminotransferase class V-fold PLP-dependent enzyme [Gemmatimonadota bacterium]